MIIKVTNEWILDFNAVRGYLRLVSRETSKPLVTLSRDLMYAIARTAKKVQSDIELLSEEDKKAEDVKTRLASAKTDPKTNGEVEELEKELLRLKADWDALLKKQIEVEVHSCKLEDFPKENVPLPGNFFETLAVLIEEPDKR